VVVLATSRVYNVDDDEMMSVLNISSENVPDFTSNESDCEISDVNASESGTSDSEIGEIPVSNAWAYSFGPWTEQNYSNILNLKQLCHQVFIGGLSLVNIFIFYLAWICWTSSCRKPY
jgi:hypothetical protein